MAIQYSLPLKITVDEDTGLLLLVDSGGKTISRGASPTIVNNLGLQKGVLSSDLPAPVDPREQAPAQSTTATQATDTPPKGTATSSVEAQNGTAQEQPLASAEQKRLEQNKNSAIQEAAPDEGDQFGNTRKVTLSPAVAEAQSASQSQSRITIGTENTEVAVLGTNLLHQYASYTYNISLHMLSKADFNQLGKDPDSNWLPTKTLIAGAGKWGVPGFTRDKNFLDDFYFDNLKITTIVGSTAGNQGTNAVELSFTIIEPYGMTLIDRLIDACLDPAVDGKNYLEIPYLIQIDFYGFDDEGKANQLIKQRKYIPINILSMTSKAGVKGAEYQLSAVPYVHSAFQESVAATPANFEVIAGTLEEFFKDVSDANDLAAAEKANQRAESQKAAKEKEQKASPQTNTGARNTGKSASSASGSDDTNVNYSVKSYVGAYNAWGQAAVKNKNATDYNHIRVKIDPIISNYNNGSGSKIVAPKSQSAKQLPEYNPKNAKERAQVARANAGKQTAQPNFNSSKFSISGQTSVMAVINDIMLSSEYIRSQVIDTTIDAQQNADKKNAPVNWWKIIPEVELRTYCTQTNKWYMNITYYIKAFTVYNRVHPNVSKDLPKGWHREYNYIYTGKNSDIIDFSIDFDTAFYTAVNIDRTKVAATQIQPNLDLEDRLTQSGEAFVEETNRSILSAIQPQSTRIVADNVNNTSASTRKDGVSMAAASLAEHFNSGQTADQLAITLKIIGDPQFIKQDEIYYSPSARRYNEVEGARNNYVTDDSSSIAMDNSEVHVKLSWKTPVDIDEETGALRTNGRYTVSAFSGIYQVLQIDSSFAQGKFEQTLSCIRLPGQATDYPGAPKETSDIRKDNLPAMQKDGGKTVYVNSDSQSVEQQKTSVLTKLLENKNTNVSTDANSNIGRVDTTPEQDASGYGEEYQNSQARALSSVNKTAPTQTANEFFGI